MVLVGAFAERVPAAAGLGKVDELVRNRPGPRRPFDRGKHRLLDPPRGRELRVQAAERFGVLEGVGGGLGVGVGAGAVYERRLA